MSEHNKRTMLLCRAIVIDMMAHLRRLTVDLGRTAELTCAVAGFPHGAPLWLKDGVALRFGARVSLPSSHVLRIAEVRKSDRGMYQCVVRAQHDMAQAAAELRLGGTCCNRQNN
jgi:hypothetical protein